MRRLVGLVVSLAALIGAGQALAAAPGDPDPAFGVGGLTSLAAGSSYVPAVQSDGKLLIGTDSLGLIRLNANGTADTSFGQGGTASISSAPPVGSSVSVLVQPDGKILVAGQLSSSFAVARYLPDGTLDSSFAAGSGHPGYVTTDVTAIVSGWPTSTDPSGDPSGIESIGLQPDGSIVALGVATQSHALEPVTPSDWLVRYTPTGALDTSFGPSGTGVAAARPGPGGRMGLTADGTILVGDPGGIYVGELRYTSAGDQTGFSGGYAPLPTDESAYPISLIAAADGSVTIAAHLNYLDGSPPPPDVVALVRFNGDGTPDAAFGSGGVAISPVPAGSAVFEAAASDRSIVVGSGTTLARFTSTGALDPSFGVGGEETINPGEPNAAITGVAVAPDGGIVATGYEGDPAHGWVARYLATGTPRPYHVTAVQTGTGRGTVTDAPVGIACGSTCTGAITPDSSTTLTETPAAGSAFVGWSVAGCGTQPTCTVTSQPGSGQVTVSAQFGRLAPQASRGPSISGTRRVGDRLTVKRGTWIGDAITYRYQWQRCTPRCRTVKHATHASYHLGAAARNHRLRAIVTATNSAGHASRTSASTSPIAAGTAELRTLLRRTLARHPSLRALAHAHGYRYTLRTLGPGTITITWRSGHVRLGASTVHFAKTRRITSRLTLTRAARSRIAHRPSKMQVTASARYTPRGMPRTTRTAHFTLRR